MVKKANAPENVGGVTKKQLSLFGDRFATLKAEADVVRSSQSTLMKEIEESGLVKAAFKAAMKLRDMEESRAAAWLNGFEDCCERLGVNRKIEAYHAKAQEARDQERTSAASAKKGNSAEAGASA